MQESEAEVLALIDRLNDYSLRMDEIMDLIGEKRRIPRDEKLRLQQLYKSLKDDLRADDKACDNRQTAPATGSLRYTHFCHAIGNAINRLHAATNSDPINSQWSTEIYSAKIDIDGILFDLRKRFPGNS